MPMEQPIQTNDLVHEAMRFAFHAHAGHRRKWTEVPYFTHLAEVAGLVATVTDDPEMIAAAYLHDTVEDTEVTLDELERWFGRRVRELVYWLTDVSTPEDGSRAERKALDREHVARGPANAQTIKYADMISNTLSVVSCNPKFARVYLPEKDALLNAADRGNRRLREMALETVEDGFRALSAL